MKVSNLAEALNMEQLASRGEDREITGVYIGDLLSIVMNKCEAGNIWITAQAHPNILSVADLNDVACVVLVGGAAIDKNLVEKAEDMGVALLSCEEEAYEIACKIKEVL